MNHTVTLKMCKFSFKRLLSMRNYFILLFLIMVVNLVITAGLYIPILKQVRSLLFSKTLTYIKYRDRSVGLQLATSQEEENPNLEIDDIAMPASFNELQVTNLNFEISSSRKARKFETFETSNEHVQNVVAKHIASNVGDIVVDHIKPLENSNIPKFKVGWAQRRVSILFFLSSCGICAFVHSPINHSYSTVYIDDFEFQELTKTEMAVRSYLLQLVFLNHIVNPFIYGIFDTKFRKQLRKCFQRQKS